MAYSYHERARPEVFLIICHVCFFAGFGWGLTAVPEFQRVYEELCPEFEGEYPKWKLPPELSPPSWDSDED